MTDPTVFVSYSYKDEAEKNRVLTHLHVLQQAGLIDVWSDDRIGAGADWQLEIEQAISHAGVAVLLVTASFLSSEFILEKEVPALLQRRQREGLVIFPVIARACAWRKVNWLARMNVRPKSGRPVWGDSGGHVDEDLAAIADEIADAVSDDYTGKGFALRPGESSLHSDVEVSALRAELIRLLCEYPPLTQRAPRDAWVMYLPDAARRQITRRDDNCVTDLTFIVNALWRAQLNDGRWPILILIDAVATEMAGLVIQNRLRRLGHLISKSYEETEDRG